MLEARAHHQLKALLRQEGGERWPHHLSLSRLVARSLHRGDQTLVRLVPGSDPSWLISLLVPLALSEAPLALVVSDPLRQRLLQVELPRLQAAGHGLALPCLEGDEPGRARVWLLNHRQLLKAWQQGLLDSRQVVIPEAELLDPLLREALEIRLAPEHWDQLRRAHPQAESSLLDLHSRLNRLVLGHPRTADGLVPLAADAEAPLRQLLALLGDLPDPWSRWLRHGDASWTSWARRDPQLLQWSLHRQPLDPLAAVPGLLLQRGAVLVGQLGAEWSPRGLLGREADVVVDLGDPPLADPLPLYAPLRQPLPNSPCYGEHLLEQSRRLVLGQAGLSVVLVDDDALRLALASGLAAEFGSRVVQEHTAPESNGVVCCRWNWWLAHQNRLPLPDQLIVALLPIASLEDPLTAAQVQHLRLQGRDWFRERLLPDGITRLQLAVAGLRRRGGRLAILDGRLRGRSWGQAVLAALEPWLNLTRLLPH
ncbi:MAG: helicase [Cyanobium sp. M30B3]|nr:MAG: helicase [Cyanobium sp. M30B3]